jgi:hypothetical protein
MNLLLALTTFGLGYLIFKKKEQECIRTLRVWRTNDKLPIHIPPKLCNNPDYNRVYWEDPVNGTITRSSGGIIEGPKFEPLSLGSFDVSAIEAPSLKATLDIPGNSVYGYIDYLMNVGGWNDTQAIAEQITIEVYEMNVGPVDQAVEGTFMFFERWGANLAARISPYVVEHGGIPFELSPDWDK